MSEFGVLSKHGSVSSHRFIPTPIAVPSRGDPRHEDGETCIRAEPIQTSSRGNGAVIGTYPIPRSAGKSLSFASSVTTASTPKDAGNHCRHLAGRGRTSPGAVHCRRSPLDRPYDPCILEPGDRADTHYFYVDVANLSSNISTKLDP